MIFVFKTFVILVVNTIDHFIVKQQVTLLIFFDIFDWVYLLLFNYEIELVISMNQTYLFTHLDSFFVWRNENHHATLKFERK